MIVENLCIYFVAGPYRGKIGEVYYEEIVFFYGSPSINYYVIFDPSEQPNIINENEGHYFILFDKKEYMEYLRKSGISPYKVVDDYKDIYEYKSLFEVCSESVDKAIRTGISRLKNDDDKEEEIMNEKLAIFDTPLFYMPGDIGTELINENKPKISISGLSELMLTSKPKIIDVTVLVPNKVVRCLFSDGTETKAVCREPDIFSLETAIGICVAKKVMGGSSQYNKAVKHGIKVYENIQAKEKELAEEQERIEKRKAKRKAYMERRAQRRADAEKERQIEIQKEAYIRAMEYMNGKDTESAESK